MSFGGIHLESPHSTLEVSHLLCRKQYIYFHYIPDILCIKIRQQCLIDNKNGSRSLLEVTAQSKQTTLNKKVSILNLSLFEVPGSEMEHSKPVQSSATQHYVFIPNSSIRKEGRSADGRNLFTPL